MSSDEEELTLAEVAKQQKRTPLHQRKERDDDDDDDDDDDEITLAEIAEKRSKETGGHPKRATPIIDDHASSRRSSGLVMFVGDDRDYARSAKKRHVRDEVAHDGTEYGDDGDSFIVDDDDDDDEEEEEGHDNNDNDDDDNDDASSDDDGGGGHFSHAVFDRIREAKAEKETSESGLGIAASLEKQGIATGASMKDHTVFESYCKFLVASLVAPGLVEETLEMRKCPDTQLWQFCRKQIEERLQGHIDSLASSQAWNGSRSKPFLNEAAKYLPFIESSEVGKDDDCEACGRKGHSIAYELTFFGPLVDTKRLYSNNPQWLEAIPRGEHRSHRFSVLCGRQCHTRLQTFSLLSHFKYKLLLALSQTVRRYWLGGGPSAIKEKSMSSSTRGLAALSKSSHALDASSVEDNYNISDGSEDDWRRDARALEEEGLGFKEFARESAAHHTSRVCEEVAHFIEYCQGDEVDQGEVEDWETKSLEFALSERRRWIDIRSGLIDSSTKRRKTVRALVGVNTDLEEERALPLRAITWSADPTRRLFVRSQAKFLAFVLLDDARVQRDLLDSSLEPIIVDEVEEKHSDISPGKRNRRNDSTSTKSKKSSVKEVKKQTLPLSRSQTRTFSRLSRLYSDELLRPLPTDKSSFFEFIEGEEFDGIRMPLGGIQSETNLIARLPIALDWEDGSFDSFFSGEIWSHTIDQQHSRFHAILTQAKTYATEDKVANDGKTPAFSIDPELDGAGDGGGSGFSMNSWLGGSGRSSNKKSSRMPLDTNAVMLNFAFSADEDIEEVKEEEDKEIKTKKKTNQTTSLLASSSLLSMSKSTTHFTKPAVNNQKEDDDDEPMTLLDIVKAQKKKG
jgi:hypothetical protein